MNPITGKISTFGGPQDFGVGPHEGLALLETPDLTRAEFRGLFLPVQPPRTTGLARRLNPAAYYLAMRWVYGRTPKSLLRRSAVRVTNPRTGKSLLCRPVDWGPATSTGRVADLSPGAAKALGLETDDTAMLELLPPVDSAPQA